MASHSIDNLTEQFRAFIISACATDPGAIVADGRWHAFKIQDTRHKSSKPGRYLLHLDGKPNGIFMDWRDQIRHKWHGQGVIDSIGREQVEMRRRQRRERQDAEFAQAARSAISFWEGCTRINGASHAYLDAKGIAPHGARYGSGEVFGLGKAECVIIPLSSAEGRPKSLQAIRSDGERRFWPGSTHEGAHYLIGNDDGQSPVVFCEGFSTAASIHEATGLPVVMCITSGNMAPVARWASHRFNGRELIVAGDDDWHLVDHPKVQRNVGRDAAEAMAKMIGGRAVFPNMEGFVTDGGDDFNDMAREFGLESVRPIFAPCCEHQTPGSITDAPQSETFTLADLNIWARTPPTPKTFLMERFLPRNEVIVATGDGGTNKSTFGLQLCACAAANRKMLGLDVMPCASLYLTAEDDDRENHWRLAKIVKAVGADFTALAGRLHIASLRGRLNNELATFDADGRLRPSPAYGMLRATIQATGAKLVVLDNVAHLYSGNENDRGQVTAFINLLYQLCQDLDVTIVLVAHRNKSGDSYSGSTAWLNAVRAQILFERSNADDSDERTMTLGKANYSKQGETLTFRWDDFALVTAADLSADRQKEISANILAASDNAVFLACLAERTRQLRAVSEKRSSTFAPTVFAAMPEAKGVGKDRLDRAMDRLFRTGQIERAELWKDADRKPVFGLRMTAGDGAVNTLRTTRETLEKGSVSNAGDARNTLSPPKGGTGAALGAAAPSPEETFGRPDLSRNTIPVHDDDDDFQAFDQPFGSG